VSQQASQAAAEPEDTEASLMGLDADLRGFLAGMEPDSDDSRRAIARRVSRQIISRALAP
jgi:hypothetical protein